MADLLPFTLNQACSVLSLKQREDVRKQDWQQVTLLGQPHLVKLETLEDRYQHWPVSDCPVFQNASHYVVVFHDCSGRSTLPPLGHVSCENLFADAYIIEDKQDQSAEVSQMGSQPVWLWRYIGTWKTFVFLFSFYLLFLLLCWFWAPSCVFLGRISFPP